MPASTLSRPQKNLSKPFSFGIRFHFQRATISLCLGSWSQLADKLAAADALTPEGVAFRYPGDLPSVSRDEGETALRLVDETHALIVESLRAYLDGGRPG
jgi:hypothetical protein